MKVNERRIKMKINMKIKANEWENIVINNDEIIKWCGNTKISQLKGHAFSKKKEKKTNNKLFLATKLLQLWYE